MNKTIVQHSNNDSNKNEDIDSLNESVSSIQDKVNINNDIVKDKRKHIQQQVYPHTNYKPNMMIRILSINKKSKIIIIRTIAIHRTIV